MVMSRVNKIDIVFEPPKDTRMLAITVHQPWAYAIMFLGKDIENRTWFFPRHLIGSILVIHSSKTLDERAVADLRARGYQIPDVLPLGHILGSVVLGKPTIDSDSKWFKGPIGWRLESPTPLKETIPFKGAQRMWAVPTDVRTKITESING